jgi:S-sulfo-L-cysteine synthase (O-acetyl-L-serine-dependent)
MRGFFINSHDMPFVTTSYSRSALTKKVKELGKLVGNTPVHEFKTLLANETVRLFAKKEWEQLSGSVKARAAYEIFRSAMETGELAPGKSLLDATSGNTGIAYAAIGQYLSIPVTLCLPENASKERKEILTSLGAQIIYTSKFEGTDGSQQMARSMAEERPDLYFYADQYKNNNNWKAHYYSTAVEIIEQVPDITHFVSGLGTTGTFVGTARRLRELKPGVKLISLQPDNPMHGLEGWKHLETAIVPTIYDSSVADENLEVSTEEAYELIKRVYSSEGLLLSPSSAANLAGAIKVANDIDEGIIVTVLPDNADKYSELIKKLL